MLCKVQNSIYDYLSNIHINILYIYLYVFIRCMYIKFYIFLIKVNKDHFVNLETLDSKFVTNSKRDREKFYSYGFQICLYS